MLNPFPIQFLSILGYFILRVIVGYIFLVLGYRHYKQRESLYPILKLRIFPFGKIATTLFVITEIVVGILFIIGLYTQIAALLTILMSAKMIVLRKHFLHNAIPSRMTYLLFFAIGCCLFITGAGAFAFDLPI